MCTKALQYLHKQISTYQGKIPLYSSAHTASTLTSRRGSVIEGEKRGTAEDAAPTSSTVQLALMV